MVPAIQLVQHRMQTFCGIRACVTHCEGDAATVESKSLQNSFENEYV
jgi:hypothetical protein